MDYWFVPLVSFSPDTMFGIIRVQVATCREDRFRETFASLDYVIRDVEVYLDIV